MISSPGSEPTKERGWPRPALQKLRFCSLLIVFSGFFLIPLGNYLGHALEAHGFLRIIPDLAENLGPLAARSVHGSVWSFHLFGFEWIDAFAFFSLTVLGAMNASSSSAILLSFVPTLLVTAFLGRVFCGWLCPLRFLLDLLSPLKTPLRSKLGGLGGLALPPQLARIRYLSLGIFTALLLLSQSHAPALLYPPSIMSRAGYELTFSRTINGSLGFIGAYLFVDLVLLTGFWCRYICPGGVLYALLGRFRLLRIRLQEEQCARCHHCAKACPLGLDPVSDTVTMECDNCGKCLSRCPNSALSFKWGHGQDR